jgi:hypothetical protein
LQKFEASAGISRFPVPTSLFYGPLIYGNRLLYGQFSPKPPPRNARRGLQTPPTLRSTKLEETCREANDAFHFYNTAIRAAWIEKYLGLQTTYSTPNLHQLEDQAITKSMHEVIPDLILSVIGRMNVESLNLPLIRATKDDIHTVKQVLEASKSYSYPRSVYDGKILPLRLYRPVTNGLQGIEQVIKRQMGLDAVRLAT